MRAIPRIWVEKPVASLLGGVYAEVMKASRRPIQGSESAFPAHAICDRQSHLRVASMTRAAERTDSTDQPVDDELGHWRNRWNVPEKHSHLARRQGALPLGDGTWLGYRRFPTSGAAESEAQRFAEYNFLTFGIRYVGPEFFPEY